MKRAAKGIVPQRKYDSFQHDFNQCILRILQMVIHTFCNVLWYIALWDEKIWLVEERLVGKRFWWWKKYLDGGWTIWMVRKKIGWWVKRFVWWSKERALPIDWKLHCRMAGYATTHLRARDRTKKQFLHTPPPNTTARKIAPIFNLSHICPCNNWPWVRDQTEEFVHRPAARKLRLSFK